MKHVLLLLFFMTMTMGAEPLALKIKTDNTGSSGPTQFTLPFYSGFTNITIDWGDGTSQVLTTLARPTHTYAVSGTYTVRISENVVGGFPGIAFGNSGDKLKLLEISQWGDVTWRSMGGAFSGCSNMTITATDAATARTGSVREFSGAWFECTSLTSFPLIDTSAGWTFAYAWYRCTGLTDFPPINTAAGVIFYGAWNGCHGLTSFPPLNTSAATDFQYAWMDCSGLTSFPLIDTSAGVFFSSAWHGCSSLTSFPLVNTSSGTDFAFTWFGCSGLTSFPPIDAGRGTDFYQAWYSCSGLISFPLINTTMGTRFQYTWASCRGLTSFPRIDTAKGTDFRNAWKGCSALVSFPEINTAAGTDFSSAWEGCSGLTSFPLIDTGSARKLYSTWYDCSGLTSFPLINTAAVTDFRNAWYGCSSLPSFPAIDTGAGTDFSSAWSVCRNLTSFPLIDTSAGTIFKGTWGSCTSLTSFPLIDTSAGTDFSYGWTNCPGLTSFPLINTALGTLFDCAWRECTGLTSFPTLDLRNMQSAVECFYGVSLSHDSYSQLLIALVAQNTRFGVTFHAGSSRYNSSAVSSRDTLTGRSWTIIDGGRLTVPTITWRSPSGITYGIALSATQLNATANVGGSFSFSPASGTVLGAGARTLTAIFTPTNGATHDVATRSVVLSVAPAALTITAISASRPYGSDNPVFSFTTSGLQMTDLVISTSLGTTATTSSAVATYPIAIGAAVFGRGSAANYIITYQPGILTVGQAPLSVIADAASRPYGTINPAFTGSLTGVVNTDGITASYASSATATTAAGIYLPMSAQAITPTLVDPDNKLGNYTITSANATLTITRATPVITWSTPTGITYGTTLSATQLNAAAQVAGSFVYSPPAGSMLRAGAGQTLSVTFTPADTDNVSAIEASQSITVEQASLTVTAVDTTMIAGGSVPLLTAVGNGFVSPDTMDVLDVAPIITTTAMGSSPTGTYPITISGAMDADYAITFMDGTLTVIAGTGGGGGSGSGSGNSGGGCGLGGSIAALILAFLLMMRLHFRASEV